MRIVVRQLSGLGNQLFQYAAGRYYASRYAASLRIAMDAPSNAHSHGFPRPFLLSAFAITAPFGPYTTFDRLILNGRPALCPIIDPLRRTLRIQSFAEVFDQRHAFLPDLPLTPNLRTLYLSGYWQSWQPAAAVQDQLRTELQLRQPATGRNLETLNRIAATPTPVSLHIRRGDYTLAAEGNIALPLDFYTAAIALLRERLPDAHFFIFSDDIPFARANLPRTLPATFVDHNDSFTAHEDLRLMSACRHHILANSSFSWWGAWLGAHLTAPDHRQSQRLVIAPRHWTGGPDATFPGLFPPDWTLLG